MATVIDLLRHLGERAAPDGENALAGPVTLPAVTDSPLTLPLSPAVVGAWARLVGRRTLGHHALALSATQTQHSVALMGHGQSPHDDLLLLALSQLVRSPQPALLALVPHDRATFRQRLIALANSIGVRWLDAAQPGGRIGQAQLIIANSSDLHRRVLRYHDRAWRWLWTQLRCIALPELHRYTTAEAGHLHWLLRRVERLATHPPLQIISSLGSVADAGATLARLLDRPVQVVAAPDGPGHSTLIALWRCGSDRGAALLRLADQLSARRLAITVFGRDDAETDRLRAQAADRGIAQAQQALVAIVAGVPRTIDDRQQLLRSGYRLLILLAGDEPHELLFAAQPDLLLNALPYWPLEIHNPYVVAPQITCAAVERPLEEAEIDRWAVRELRDRLIKKNVLQPLPSGDLWQSAPDIDEPYAELDPRAVGGEPITVLSPAGEPLATIPPALQDRCLLPRQVFEPGWQIARRDERSLTVQLAPDPDERVTVVLADMTVRVREELAARTIRFGKQTTDLVKGKVWTTQRIAGLRELRADATQRRLAANAPQTEWLAAACWISLTTPVADPQAIGWAIAQALPIVALAPPAALAPAYDAEHQRLYLIEAEPGGVGIIDCIYHQCETLIDLASQIAQACSARPLYQRLALAELTWINALYGRSAPLEPIKKPQPTAPPKVPVPVLANETQPETRPIPSGQPGPQPPAQASAPAEQATPQPPARTPVTAEQATPQPPARTPVTPGNRATAPVPEQPPNVSEQPKPPVPARAPAAASQTRPPARTREATPAPASRPPAARESTPAPASRPPAPQPTNGSHPPTLAYVRADQRSSQAAKPAAEQPAPKPALVTPPPIEAAQPVEPAAPVAAKQPPGGSEPAPVPERRAAIYSAAQTPAIPAKAPSTPASARRYDAPATTARPTPQPAPEAEPETIAPTPTSKQQAPAADQRLPEPEVTQQPLIVGVEEETTSPVAPPIQAEIAAPETATQPLIPVEDEAQTVARIEELPDQPEPIAARRPTIVDRLGLNQEPEVPADDALPAPETAPDAQPPEQPAAEQTPPEVEQPAPVAQDQQPRPSRRISPRYSIEDLLPPVDDEDEMEAADAAAPALIPEEQPAPTANNGRAAPPRNAHPGTNPPPPGPAPESRRKQMINIDADDDEDDEQPVERYSPRREPPRQQRPASRPPARSPHQRSEPPRPFSQRTPIRQNPAQPPAPRGAQRTPPQPDPQRFDPSRGEHNQPRPNAPRPEQNQPRREPPHRPEPAANRRDQAGQRPPRQPTPPQRDTSQPRPPAPQQPAPPEPEADVNAMIARMRRLRQEREATQRPSPPRTERPAPREPVELRFHIGERVQCLPYGIGTVRASRLVSGREQVLIDFPEYGEIEVDPALNLIRQLGSAASTGEAAPDET